MPHAQRKDGPDTWHHVMNRAIARRTFFERPDDVTCFEHLLAEAVAEKWVEVHCFAILPTHFHLLARSPAGELSRALRHVQLAYVRWFNRSRKRDGPLVRQRFRSNPVESLRYRHVLVGYIDDNAPHARMAPDAAAYPYGSAFHYTSPGSTGPAWLERRWVEGVVCAALGLETYDPDRYAEVFARGFRPGHRALVEAAIAHRRAGPAAVERILGASDDATLAWMRRKAELADGTCPGVPVVAADFIEQALDATGRPRETWLIHPRGHPRDGWKMLQALLLRHLAGVSFAAMGDHLGCSREGARIFLRDAVRALRDDDLFIARARGAGRLAIDLCYTIGG